MKNFKELLNETQIIPSDIFKDVKKLRKQLDRLDKLIKLDTIPKNKLNDVGSFLNNTNRNLTKLIGL